jgi:hypothetical protein
MRMASGFTGVLAALGLAGAAHAERICTAAAPGDPAVTVSLHLTDDGMMQGGEVHWAVPNVRSDLPSMVHIVYPLVGDHAGPRPNSVITLHAVTGDEFSHSPTASIQIVIDGMQMAVRAWGLYAQAVAQLNGRPATDIAKASFVGAVPFTASFDDGRRDLDSSEALIHIGQGAHTLQVRLLGQDGMALQDHTYRLFDMPVPPAGEVQTALAAGTAMIHKPGACPSY